MGVTKKWHNDRGVSEMALTLIPTAYSLRTSQGGGANLAPSLEKK